MGGKSQPRLAQYHDLASNVFIHTTTVTVSHVMVEPSEESHNWRQMQPAPHKWLVPRVPDSESKHIWERRSPKLQRAALRASFARVKTRKPPANMAESTPEEDKRSQKRNHDEFTEQDGKRKTSHCCRNPYGAAGSRNQRRFLLGR